jgi:hypothetical protein
MNDSLHQGGDIARDASDSMKNL